MARPKRVWYEGACYHVMGRGNRRSAIFRKEEDYQLFFHLLRSVQERIPFIVHAYCLMTNHFHIELTTKEVPIWRIMQQVMNYYARTFNQKYGFDGHLFDSRYASSLIEDEVYFLEVSRYIHLNPVKAGMVRQPLDYTHSSYRQYVSGEQADKGFLVDTDRVLGSFRFSAREQYRMFVEGRISHAEQEQLIQKDIKEDDMWLPW